MCDIWKANSAGTSLDLAVVDRLLGEFRDLGVEWVVLSGGEALMHPNLWALCERLKSLGVKITLLSSGLLLARHAADIVRWCDEVIVSLDGTQPTHNTIRGIKNAYRSLADGIRALRHAKADFPVAARCVIQRGNFRELPAIVDAAREIGLDHLSFLAADLSSTAFNRPAGWDEERSGEVGLNRAESQELVAMIERLIQERPQDFASRFIQESPDRLRRIAAYSLAAHGLAPLPKVSCNAPWVSTVIDSDGTVRPCFFHAPLGNVGETGLSDILNSPAARSFRGTLDMSRDPVCRRCVCTLKL